MRIKHAQIKKSLIKDLLSVKIGMIEKRLSARTILQLVATNKTDSYIDIYVKTL